MKPGAVAPGKRIISAAHGCTVASAQSDANNNTVNLSSSNSSSNSSTMTLEEIATGSAEGQTMQTVEQALEELLVGAHKQGDLTVGVYESAKLLNADPDSVVLCLLAADADEEADLALQIHFTLIQAFCGDNDIDVLRVRGVARLAQLLSGDAASSGGQGLEEEEEEEGDDASSATNTTSSSSCATTSPADEPRDLHCLLLTAPLPSGPLRTVASFCAESRFRNQWVPSLNLTER